MHFYCFSTFFCQRISFCGWLLIIDYWLLIRFFFQQRITLITLIIRAVRVICCLYLFIRFIWFIWWLSSLLCLLCHLLFFINIGCHGFHGFFVFVFVFVIVIIIVFVFVSPRRPFRSSNLVPRLCRGGRCAARYPHGPQQPANKNTLDYDVCSRRWSRTTAKAMQRAGWGRGDFSASL